MDTRQPMTWQQFNVATRLRTHFGKRTVSLAPAGGTDEQPHVAITYVREGDDTQVTRVYYLEQGKLKEVP